MSLKLPASPALGDPLPPAASPEVLRFLALRRSSSAVTLAEPAPSPGELDELLRLATRVPDHGKLSPWRFIVLRGDDKTAFAQRLDDLAQSRGDGRASAKLAKLKIPPLGVAVVFSPRPGDIPQWEQELSAGAVCATLLYGALAAGFGANWITDWYSYDAEAGSILGLRAGERVAGFVLLGTPKEPPQERERPDLDPLVSAWKP